MNTGGGRAPRDGILLALLLAGGGRATGCSPHEVELFPPVGAGTSAGGGTAGTTGGASSGGSSTGGLGSAGLGTGAQGSGATGSGAGPTSGGGETGLAGSPPEGVPPLIDDFEDQDTRALPPAGWWYLVNDATGYQQLAIARNGLDGGSFLRTAGQGFSDWGAGIGVDIGELSLPSTTTHLRFSGRATTDLAVEVQIVETSERRFTTSVMLTPDWQTLLLPLDAFVSGESPGLSLDAAAADELHWFVLGQPAFDFSIDDVGFSAN